MGRVKQLIIVAKIFFASFDIHADNKLSSDVLRFQVGIIIKVCKAATVIIDQAAH